jgi:hypothetical protein
MPQLVWDETGTRTYETGVDHGVLYIPDATGNYITGVAWNGLTTVTESPSGAEANAQYADNIKYLNLFSAEEFGATIEAFTYPDEFNQFDGLATPTPGLAIGQQSRKVFGLSYRTRVGNDLEGEDYGYKLHLLYGCQASPSEKAYQTINDSPAAIAFSWAVTTTPVPVTDYRPTSLITVNSAEVDAAALTALESALYGAAAAEPMLPLPDEVIAMFPSGGGGATGASAGTPGSWTPGGSNPPASVAALQGASPSIAASPTTAWTTGQYVQTGTAGAPGQAHWNGTAWVAGPA